MIIEGIVVQGRRLGRRLGFPTANIEWTGAETEMPDEGVYAAVAEIDGRRYAAVANWGTNPSVEGGCRPRLETHILDFEGELYGRRLRVELLRRIRGERRFSSLDELRSQIQADCRTVRDSVSVGCDPRAQRTNEDGIEPAKTEQ